MISTLNMYNYRLFTWALNLGICFGMLIALAFKNSSFFWLVFGIQLIIVIIGFKNESAKLQDNDIFRKQN